MVNDPFLKKTTEQAMDALLLTKLEAMATDEPDLLPMVHVHREKHDRLIHIASIVGHGSQGPGFAAYAASVAFRPTILVLTCDSLMKTMTVEEETPPHGSLSDEWLAGKREGLSEALTVQAVNRGGCASIIAPYTIDGDEITFVDVSDSSVIDGNFLHAMRAGWDSPEIAQRALEEIDATIAKVLGEIPEEAREALRDAAAAKALSEEGYTVALAEPVV